MLEKAENTWPRTMVGASGGKTYFDPHDTYTHKTSNIKLISLAVLGKVRLSLARLD
jgi:hypothetical protein